MKKKLISLLLCVAMVASMVIGCGSKEEPAAEAPAATEEEAEAPAETDGELPTITFHTDVIMMNLNGLQQLKCVQSIRNSQMRMQTNLTS